MSEASSILISLHAKHAENVLSGSKTVEVRRRKLHVQSGTRVWIYATHPRAALVGFATIRDVISDSPKNIWSMFGAEIAIEKHEFEQYLCNSETACAILLNGVTALLHEVPLAQLRKLDSDFHPPQFFARMNGLAAKLSAFERPARRVRNHPA